MKYKKCGYELLEDAMFCANCGASVEAEDTRMEEEAFDEPKEKSGNPLKKMGIAVGTSLEVGGILGAVLNRKKKKK